MLITELQTKLDAIKADHGDLQVLIDCNEEYFSEEFDLDLVMLDNEQWKNEDQFKDDYCAVICNEHSNFKPQAVVFIDTME